MTDNLGKNGEESLFIDAAFVIRIPQEFRGYDELYRLAKSTVDKLIYENETLAEFLRVKIIIGDVRVEVFYAVFGTPADPYHHLGFLTRKLINPDDKLEFTDSVIRAISRYTKGIYDRLLREKLLNGGDECLFESIEFVGMQKIDKNTKMFRDLINRFSILQYKCHLANQMRFRDVMKIHYIVDGVSVEAFYAVVEEKGKVHFEFLYSDPVLQNFDFTYNNFLVQPILNRAKESYLDRRFN